MTSSTTCIRFRQGSSDEAHPALDEAMGSRMLTPAERNEAMAEALRNWDEVERQMLQERACATERQAAREAARDAAGLPPKCEAELAHEARLEQELAELKRRRALRPPL